MSVKVMVPVGPDAPGVKDAAVRAETAAKFAVSVVESPAVINVAPVVSVGVAVIGETVIVAGLAADPELKVASPEYVALTLCEPPESIGACANR